MTRKDYEMIAEVVRRSAVPLGHKVILARNFARRLEADERFDRDRFLKAAGVADREPKVELGTLPFGTRFRTGMFPDGERTGHVELTADVGGFVEVFIDGEDELSSWPTSTPVELLEEGR